MATSSDLIRAVFSRFREAGITYCVLRDYERLPEDHGNDLDMFIDPPDFRAGLEIIHEQASTQGFRLLAETRPTDNRKLYLVPPGGGKVLIMDIFRGIYWKGVPIASNDCLVSSIRDHGDIRVAAAGPEGAVTLVKELLQWGKVKERRGGKQRIQLCANEDPGGFVCCLSPQFGPETSRELLALVKAGDWESVEGACRRLRSAAVRAAVRGAPFRQIGRWCLFLRGHAAHRLRPPLGFFAVLLGPDGSGKTTLAAGLERFWLENVHAPTVHVHGDFKLVPRLKGVRHLASKLRGREPAPDVDFTERHSGASVKPHSALRSAFALLYYMWDYMLGHVVVRSARTRDRLVVADRYFHDYYFQPANARLPRGLLNAVRRIVPRPDLVCVLDREADSIYAGKDELTVAEIERQQHEIKQIAGSMANAETVDCNHGADDALDRITGMIVDRLVERNSPSHPRTCPRARAKG